MRFCSAISTADELETACGEVAERIRAGIGDGGIDLLFVFVSPDYRGDLAAVPVWLHEALPVRALAGCTGGGILGAGREVEGKGARAVSALACRGPGLQVTLVHVENGDLPSPDAPPQAWRALVPVPAEELRGLVVLPEPFHCHVENLLAGLDFAFPAVPKVGGIASGRTHPDGNALFVNRQTLRRGAVIAALSGDVQVDTLVAQGCRPIGRPGRITKAERNRLFTIEGVTTMQFLEQQILSLDDADVLRRCPLFLGLAMDPFASSPQHGDFLIRHIFELDQQTGAMTIGAPLTVGRTVQFHVRDRAASVDDLDLMLQRKSPRDVDGALLFSCLGRGAGLYGRPDHDSRAFTAAAPRAQLAGFFCNGEIGPVGGVTHLHGYTSAFALFRPLGITDG